MSRRLAAALHQRALRFWLPKPRHFAYVAVDFDPGQATFALWCLRRNQQRGLELVNAVPNRFRLRELEATLVELNLSLPESLRRYFVAALGDDEAELRVRSGEMVSFLCRCHDSASASRAMPGFAA